jgi:hypothetical protein
MLKRRVPLRGVLAALLALLVQFAIGATVPQAGARQSGVRLAGIAMAPICHADGSSGGIPGPSHPPACVVCPMCGAVYAPSLALPAPAIVFRVPSQPSSARPELPPPPTAPPSFAWPPNQARAPPTVS